MRTAPIATTVSAWHTPNPTTTPLPPTSPTVTGTKANLSDGAASTSPHNPAQTAGFFNAQKKGAIVHLYDLIDRADLEQGLREKLINIRTDGDGLHIYNYSAAAMYTPGAWDNPAVRACRGIITTHTGELAARPWAKFFNHGQAEAGTLDLNAPVEVTDKLDGSLGILHKSMDDEPRVATRGSFQSEQAIHATATLNRLYPKQDWNDVEITPLVEIVYPQNRIVCDYGEMDDLILLGGVGVRTGDYHSPADIADWIDWQGPVAEVFPYATLGEALAAPPRPNSEGLCVRYLHEPNIVKIKQDDYVALHRIVTGLSERTVWEHMVHGGALEGLLGDLPDELHDWTRDVWGQISNKVANTAMIARSTHTLIQSQIGERADRKAYALAAQKHPDVRPYLFQLLDGRDPAPSILKTLRPAGDTRAVARTEDIA